jgi:hypothetical protein
MTQPANLRVNAAVPFPAMVQGSGPITVAKNAGRFIIGFAAQLLGLQNPLANALADQVLVWDPIAKSLILTSVNTIVSTGGPQRSITAAGNLPITAADVILNINNVADLTPVVPLAAPRLGTPLTFKNLPGSHVQTLQRTGADTFDGAATYGLGAGQSVTLRPYNDGVNAGYGIE